MPIGYSLHSATLDRVVNGGTPVRVGLSELQSPWPDHFAVLGIMGPAGSNHLAVWPPGIYRLVLTFDPGAAVSRTLQIDVTAPPGG